MYYSYSNTNGLWNTQDDKSYYTTSNHYNSYFYSLVANTSASIYSDCNLEESTEIISNILNYVKDNFKKFPDDAKYYELKDFILRPCDILELKESFDEIKNLNPKIYQYEILRDNLCGDIILAFKTTRPNKEQFMNEVASKYFELDDVWDEELRFLK